MIQNMSRDELLQEIITSRTANEDWTEARPLEITAAESILDTGCEPLIDVARSGKDMRDTGIKGLLDWYNRCGNCERFLQLLDIINQVKGISAVAKVFKGMAADMLGQGAEVKTVVNFLKMNKKNKGVAIPADKLLTSKKLKESIKANLSGYNPEDTEHQRYKQLSEVVAKATDNYDEMLLTTINNFSAKLKDGQI